jgi:DNA-directed RNA polymerase subunit E'/Rpb7
MSSIQTITRRFCLEPRYLDKNYEENLLEKIKDITNNECSREYGYFINIIKILKIKDIDITRNSEIVCNTEFQAETLFPVKGKEFTGTIGMIFNSGVFVIIKNKLKVLIPLDQLSEYTFDNINNTFVMNKDSDKLLKKDGKIKISILDIRYSKNQFSCFGKII